MQERAVYGAAVAVFRDYGGGVLCVDFSGPLTPVVLGRFRHDIAEHGAKMRAGAAMVSLQRAVVAMERAGMAQPQSTLADLPIALIVTDALLSEFRAHAWEMAQRGYLRGAFTDASPALEWALTKVGLGRPAPRPGQRSHAL